MSALKVGRISLDLFAALHGDMQELERFGAGEADIIVGRHPEFGTIVLTGPCSTGGEVCAFLPSSTALAA
jgi:hypothetical protein